MVRVAILGGGVGGLSAAHELVERGFSVAVYERRPWWGGKARSMPDPGTGTGGRQDLPGEHGFRFFPGFYKHLPDTMSRIPFPGNSNGVVGNLVDTTQVEMMQEASPPIVTPSRFPESLDEWLSAIYDMFSDHPGIPSDQIAFFAHRVLQVLTSCQDRRLAEYEKVAWWNFINADQMSDEYKKILAEGLTRSLVAMRQRSPAPHRLRHPHSAHAQHTHARYGLRSIAQRPDRRGLD